MEPDNQDQQPQQQPHVKSTSNDNYYYFQLPKSSQPTANLNAAIPPINTLTSGPVPIVPSPQLPVNNGGNQRIVGQYLLPVQSLPQAQPQHQQQQDPQQQQQSNDQRLYALLQRQQQQISDLQRQLTGQHSANQFTALQLDQQQRGVALGLQNQQQMQIQRLLLQQQQQQNNQPANFYNQQTQMPQRGSFSSVQSSTSLPPLNSFSSSNQNNYLTSSVPPNPSSNNYVPLAVSNNALPKNNAVPAVHQIQKHAKQQAVQNWTSTQLKLKQTVNDLPQTTTVAVKSEVVPTTQPAPVEKITVKPKPALISPNLVVLKSQGELRCGLDANNTGISQDFITGWLHVSEFLACFKDWLREKSPNIRDHDPLSPVIGSVRKNNRSTLKLKNELKGEVISLDSSPVVKLSKSLNKTDEEDPNEIIVIDSDDSPSATPTIPMRDRLISDGSFVTKASPPQTPPLAPHPTQDSTRYSERELNTLFEKSISQFVLMALMYTPNSQMYRYILVELLAPLVHMTSSPEISLLNLLTHSKNKVNGNLDKLTVTDLDIYQSFPMEEETIGFLLKVFLKRTSAKRSLQQLLVSAGTDDVFGHLDANQRLDILNFVMSKWLDMPEFAGYIDKMFEQMLEAESDYYATDHLHKVNARKKTQSAAIVKQSTKTKNSMNELSNRLSALTADVAHLSKHMENMKTYLEQLQVGSGLTAEVDPKIAARIDMARNELNTIRKSIAIKVEQHKMMADEMARMDQQYKAQLVEEAHVERLAASKAPVPVDSAEVLEKHKLYEQYRLRTFFLQNQAIGRDANQTAYWMLQTVNGVIVTHDGKWCRYVNDDVQHISDALTHSSEQRIKATLRYWSGSTERFQTKLAKESGLRTRLINGAYGEALAANTCNLFNYIVRVSLNPVIRDEQNPTYHHFNDYAADFDYHASVKTLLHESSQSYFGPVYSYITSIFRILITPKKVSSRKKPSNYAPLLFCFTDHEIEQVRVADLKQTEQILNTYRRLLVSCNSLDEIAFLVMLLHETIQTNVEDEPAYQNIADDVSFKEWIELQRIVKRSQNSSSQSLATSSSKSSVSRNNENDSGNSQPSSTGSADFVVKVVESDNEQLSKFIDVSPRLKQLGIPKDDTDDDDFQQPPTKRSRKARNQEDTTRKLPKIKLKLNTAKSENEKDEQPRKSRTRKPSSTLKKLDDSLASSSASLQTAYTISTASLSQKTNDDDDVDFTTTSSDGSDNETRPPKRNSTSRTPRRNSARSNRQRTR